MMKLWPWVDGNLGLSGDISEYLVNLTHSNGHFGHCYFLLGTGHLTRKFVFLFFLLLKNNNNNLAGNGRSLNHVFSIRLNSLRLV